MQELLRLLDLTEVDVARLSAWGTTERARGHIHSLRAAISGSGPRRDVSRDDALVASVTQEGMVRVKGE